MALKVYSVPAVAAERRHFMYRHDLESLLVADDVHSRKREAAGVALVSVLGVNMIACGNRCCWHRQLDMSALRFAEPLPEDEGKIKVGRYALWDSGAGHGIRAVGRLCKRKQDEIRSMSVADFMRHHHESPLVFAEPPEPLAVVSDYFRGVHQVIDDGAVFKYDYAINEVTDVDVLTGYHVPDEFPCLLREAAAQGMLSPEGKRLSWAGVTTWYRYRGTRGSTFAMHREDKRLFSINFLFRGAPKLWLVTSPEYYERVLLELKHDLMLAGDDEAACPAFEMHKSFMLDEDWYKSKGIAVNVVMQKPGQAVILYPRAVHSGFNLGLNDAIATNFGLQSWLPDGLNCPVVSPGVKR